MPIPVESFFLPPAANGTLQQRIRQLVAEGIVSGRFRPGERMPSSRGLAGHLGISRITVTLAYTELVSSDYLTARGRSGYFVSDTAPVQPDLRGRGPRAQTAVDFARLTGERFSRSVRLDKPDDWARYPYPFIYGQADSTLFDHQNWRQCALRALGRRDFDALTKDYYEQDDPLLIEYILRGILPRRGIDARPEEVLLTMGAQNALWLAAEVLLTPGRRVAMENPGYPPLRAMLMQTGAAVLSVDVDQGGLPPEALPDGVDVVFTTASHHCPTNATMPLERRMRLLAEAKARDMLIVEDDYEFEMSFLRPVAPSLKSLDAEGRVIHVGSFSKSLFPGLRLGYMVAPEGFIREARALRAQVLRHPPGHIQRTAAYFLSLGHYDALINRMKQTFRRRRLVMDEAIRSHGLMVAGQGGFGGSSFWMRAPDGVDTAKLAVRLQAAGVLIEPGLAFFDPARGRSDHYRLAYSSIAAPRIPDGIAIIAKALADWT
jgi:GntR family transcriptional regulator/MocR family aminotransferase